MSKLPLHGGPSPQAVGRVDVLLVRPHMRAGDASAGGPAQVPPILASRKSSWLPPTAHHLCLPTLLESLEGTSPRSKPDSRVCRHLVHLHPHHSSQVTPVYRVPGPLQGQTCMQLFGTQVKQLSVPLLSRRHGFSSHGAFRAPFKHSLPHSPP